MSRNTEIQQKPVGRNAMERNGSEREGAGATARDGGACWRSGYLFTIRAGTESVRIAPSTIDAASIYMPESVLLVTSFNQPTA